MHVPAEIGGRAIEPVIDHLGDLGAACKGAVKHIVVDAILGEQLGETRAVMLFNGVAEGAQHGCDVHGVSPYILGPSFEARRRRLAQNAATAAMARATSCGHDRRWS